MDRLIDRVGSSVDRAAALKALLTWVDLGVLKEEGENTFSLLEVAETAVPGAYVRESRAGNDFFESTSHLLTAFIVANAAMELPSAPSVQQQQAEQMKIYWKVRAWLLLNFCNAHQSPFPLVYRRHAYELGLSSY